MAYLQLLFAVVFPALLGLCFVNIFLNKPGDASLPERMAFGFCAGLMLITLVMFYVLSPLGIKYSVLSISLPLLIVIVIGGYLSVKNGLIPLSMPKPFKFERIEILLMVLIILQVAFVSFSLFIKPVSGWDAWQSYSMRAKAYYIDGTANIAALPSTVRGQHVPLIQTWMFECINRWNEIVGKIPFALLYLSLIILFYCAIRRINERPVSLMATYALSALPFLVYHATLEYCDLIIAVYLFAGVSLMYLWFNDPNIRYLLLSFIFLFSMVTIKKEAYFHLPIVFIILVFAVFSKRFDNINRIKIFRSILIASVIAGGLYIFQIMFLHPFEVTHYSVLPDLSRLLPMLSAFGELMFIRNNWNIVWAILIVFLLFNFDRLKVKNLSIIFAMVMLELFGFMAFYLSVDRYIYEWLFFVTPAVRNMLQFMPIVMFLIALLMGTVPTSIPISRRLGHKGKKES